MDLKDKTVNMNFRLSKDLRDAMRARADYLGVNMSQFFRNAMERELNIDRSALVESDLKGVPVSGTRAIKVYCPKELFQAFDTVCKKQNLAKTVVLRQLISDYVKKNQ